MTIHHYTDGYELKKVHLAPFHRNIPMEPFMGRLNALKLSLRTRAILRFAKANPRTATVLIDEFHTCIDQDAPNYLESFGIARISPDLNVGDGVTMEPRRCG
jgi:hypothetical protein